MVADDWSSYMRSSERTSRARRDVLVRKVLAAVVVLDIVVCPWTQIHGPRCALT